MQTTTPVTVDRPSQQIRELWRCEPRVSAERRTHLMERLHELRSRLEQLGLEHRAGRIDDHTLEEATAGIATEFDRLRTAWS